MVVASQTIIVAGLATAVLGERLTRLGWLGVVVGFGGVALISLNGGDGLHVDLQVLSGPWAQPWRAVSISSSRSRCWGATRPSR